MPGQMSDVVWHDVAEPRNDQYDALIALRYAEQAGYQRTERSGEPSFFAGKIAVRNDQWHEYFPTDYMPAPTDHPNIAAASTLVGLWETGFKQCQLLIESVAVFLDPGRSENEILGSSCGSGPHFGTIVSTINSPVGFAEAMVHEMAHHKLRALGVELESAERIVTNSPGELYPSPIRYDALRPMPAVLHAQYSYTYVCALVIRIIRAGLDRARDRQIAQVSLAGNLPKLEFGRSVIQQCAHLDRAGDGFLEGYLAWLDRVLEDGNAILRELQLPLAPFAHPLAAQETGGCERFMGKSKRLETGIVDRFPLRHESVRESKTPEGTLLYAPWSRRNYSLNSSAEGNRSGR